MPKIVNHPAVAHVGTMDPSLKNAGSQEGSGLSVSIHPVAWARIHRIGDEGFILEGPGRFLDALKLSTKERAAVWDWAGEQGLVEDAVIWTVSYEDDEIEDVVVMEFASEEDALEEADELLDAVVDSHASTVATRRLAELCDQNPERIGPDQLPSSFQFDLILSLWAERHVEGIDGIWWNERLDPDAYSAPRGLIFASRLKEWTARAADLQDLQAFQNECRPGAGRRYR